MTVITVHLYKFIAVFILLTCIVHRHHPTQKCENTLLVLHYTLKKKTPVDCKCLYFTCHIICSNDCGRGGNSFLTWFGVGKVVFCGYNMTGMNCLRLNNHVAWHSKMKKKNWCGVKCIVTVCVFVRHLFSFYPFYFDFHSARVIFDLSSGFYLWNINKTTAWHL